MNIWKRICFWKKPDPLEELEVFLRLIEELALKEIELCTTENELNAAKKFYFDIFKKMQKELWGSQKSKQNSKKKSKTRGKK